MNQDINMKRLSQAQLGYLAGLIDSKGSLQCKRSMNKRRVTPVYSIRLSFTFDTEEPGDTIREWLGLQQKYRADTDEPRDYLLIPKKVTIFLLGACLPYLTRKVDQARLILEIEEIRKTNTPNRHEMTPLGSVRMPAEVVAQMEELHRQLQELKMNKNR